MPWLAGSATFARLHVRRWRLVRVIQTLSHELRRVGDGLLQQSYSRCLKALHIDVDSSSVSQMLLMIIRTSHGTRQRHNVDDDAEVKPRPARGDARSKEHY